MPMLTEIDDNELQDEMTRQFADYYFHATDRTVDWATPDERHSFECGFTRGIEFAMKLVLEAGKTRKEG